MLITRGGNGHSDYYHGSRTGMYLLETMRYLLLTRPLEEFRHESDKVPAYQLPFMQRFFWVIYISPRGFGWSFKDDRPIPVRHRTRVAFIVSRLRMALAWYLLFDVTRLYTRANPVFSTGASVASQGYVLRCLNIIAWWIQVCGPLQFGHSLIAAFAVATNLSEPSTWPPLFGYWKDAYTIRRFWARTWHQILRYLLTIFGPHRYNCRPWDDTPTTRKPKDPWARSYLRLCMAFVLSALLHAVADLAIQFRIWEQPLPAGTLSPDKVHHPFVIGVSSTVFLFQPLGVLVEGAVIEMGKYLGVKTGTGTKIIGYAWVWAWMSFTAVSSLDGLKNAMQIAYSTAQWGGGPTVVERVAGKVFGVDLPSVLSMWFASV
ncbi:hypothetical protein SCLCIDRAFT_15243 [Scleroderma citrinum Foug A]|uniref:Wax synthase domain-containing protein n=1 Tax=Scleroderma citrinum Foug A TaxID=1036808 RepID=A0A0C3AHT6_9AGAM|nr:hypothetical protein SCLCIDRAFT_15243 [Scleroderma citrinum Foug A]